MKHCFQTLCILIVAAFLFVCPASAGSPPADCAIQFQIISGPQLTDFQGGSFSGWMHSGGKYDYRFGIELATNRETTKNSLETTECETFLALSFQLLRHASWAPVCLYYGFGPALTYSASKTSYKGSSVPADSKYDSFGIGAVGVVGAEVFVRRDISLTGEYGMMAGYSSSKSGSIKYSKLFLGNMSVRFGLSVYLNK